MPSLDFEVFCSKCGAGLCLQTKVEGTSVYIEPCQNCLDTAEQDGYEKGEEHGLEEGYAKGYYRAELDYEV